MTLHGVLCALMLFKYGTIITVSFCILCKKIFVSDQYLHERLVEVLKLTKCVSDGHCAGYARTVEEAERGE